MEAITGTLRASTPACASAPTSRWASTTRARCTSGGPGSLAAADDVGRLGFGPVFQRMWELYLAYSEAGFRAGYLDVHQLLLERPAP